MPVQPPTWAKRVESKVTRENWRSKCRGLEVRLGEPVVDGVELEAPLVGLDDHPHLLQAFEHLDPDRADRGVHPVGAEDLRRADDPVVIAPEHRHEGVGNAQVGVLADADHTEELLIRAVHVARTAVDVEVVAVIEVPVGCADMPHRLGDLVDRVVVEGGEHGITPVSGRGRNLMPPGDGTSGA